MQARACTERASVVPQRPDSMDVNRTPTIRVRRLDDEDQEFRRFVNLVPQLPVSVIRTPVPVQIRFKSGARPEFEPDFIQDGAGQI